MEPNNFPVTDLLQKFLDGTISDTESETLFAWLKENPAADHPELESVLEKNYRRSFEEPPALTAAAGNRILQRLIESTAAPVVPIRRRWMPYAAAVALLLITATATMIIWRPKDVTPIVNNTNAVKPGNHAFLTLADGKQIQLDSAYGNIVQQQGLQVANNKGELDYKGKAGSVEMHTLSTPKGGQYRLLLPDGTAVWLNAESSITFPTAFHSNSREVKMSGEVYFEVKPAANQPFKVNIDGKNTIEVLGTEFNVNAYTNEPAIRATLIQGSVRILHDHTSAVLKPGQQGVVSQDQLDVNNNVDIEMVVAWKEGLFRFDRTPLETVLRQLSRWYDVDVIYEKGIPNILFSGEIKRDLDLNQALTVLSTMGVHYKIDGRKLVIMP
ncbi:FecR protein [Chitinophaga dinghuensis]|uniref:FecR protein n=1 Tax=Chitinophaga dinghuensis TaxID=1539050 RepID=A0A327VS46_9BACT|nr:FecR family protein [Chitinophaga dinghuensis]RAJ76778.1 FecR protein [Chitinophaga dinghuensis]